MSESKPKSSFGVFCFWVWVSSSDSAVGVTTFMSENTMLYIRMYQSLVRAPGLKQALNWLGRVSNLYIERQDKRVVITQEPKRSDLDIGEVLIQGDGPIITYRKIRRALIEEKAE